MIIRPAFHADRIRWPPVTRGSRLILTYWLPAAAWAAVILAASSDALAASRTASWLGVIVEEIVGHPLPARQFDVLHFLIRKTAHLTEYAILGGLLFRAMRAGAATRWTRRWSAAAIALAAAVAAVDELHQLFVPSRTGTPADVLLDCAGAALAQVVAWFRSRQAWRTTPAQPNPANLSGMSVILPLLLATIITPSGPPVRNFRVLSQTYTIDRKYRSMEGPSSMKRIVLGDPQHAELLWITGIRTEMVAEDGTTPQLAELMCHVNVDLDATRHQALFGFDRPVASRLMTLSQGMLSAKLPPGFGFPIASNEPLLLFTQVLNLNIEHPNNLKVRHRVTIDYIRDRELTSPIKPLFNVGASGMVELDNNPMALASMATSSDSGAGQHGTSCLIGSRAPNATASSADYVDPQGRHMTGHWIVPPGRQVNHSDITWFMNLPYDTRLHYAAVHLHPYAREIILRDTTTGSVVFRSRATNPMSGTGLTHVERFTSVDGVPLYKSHKYEVVSIYENTTMENADSMASLFLGLDDPEFTRRSDDELTRRSAALFDSSMFILHTSAGDAPGIMARDRAPQTAIQFGRLMDGGVLAGAKITASASAIEITFPLDARTRKLLQPLDKEPGGAPQAGAMSYCLPAAGDANIRLTVALTDAAANARCITFARIIGLDALRLAAAMPSPRITGAEAKPVPPPPTRTAAAR